MGCCNPGNCSSADVEESLVHQSFCFALLVMGYFESLWIFEIVSVSWLFMNNEHKKKTNKKQIKPAVPKEVWCPHHGIYSKRLQTGLYRAFLAFVSLSHISFHFFPLQKWKAGHLSGRASSSLPAGLNTSPVLLCCG